MTEFFDARLPRRGFLGTVAATAALTAIRARAAAPPLRLFDTHIHLISENLARYPRVKGEVPAGGAPGGGPPPGASVQQGKPHPIPTRDHVLGWWDAAHVESGAPVQKKGTYGYDNSYILDASDATPARMAPVVVLDANDPATAGQVDRLARERGLAGVRLTGPRDDFTWLSSPTALDTWGVAARHGLVIDLMYVVPGFHAPALDEIARLAGLYPQVRVVLDHLGWPPVAGAPDFGIDATFARRVAARNILFKLTTINLDMLEEAHIPAPGFVAQAVTMLGADRVMWGSDMGNTAGTYEEMVARILSATATLPPGDRARVLHDTGKRTFVRGGRVQS